MAHKEISPVFCSVCGQEKNFTKYNHAAWAKGVCSKKCLVKIEGYSERYQAELDRLKAKVEGSTAWRPLPPEPTLNIISTKPVLVIGDIHLPIHNHKWCYQALLAARKFECEYVCINGDLIDASTVSRHLGGEWRRKNELNDDIEAASVFLKILCEEFKGVYYTLGNHSQRLIHKFMGEVSWQNLVKVIYSHENFKATERHFLDINGSVRCLHPRGYSRTRGKLTADLAQRYQMHLVTGHHHHSTSTISADGKWQAVEVGTLADISMFGYAQYAMHGMPEMLEGFAIVLPQSMNNKVLNFNKFTPWEVFGLPPI